MKTISASVAIIILLTLAACGKRERAEAPAQSEPTIEVANVTNVEGANTTITGGNLTVSSQTVINAQTPLVQPREVTSTASASATVIVVPERESAAASAEEASTVETIVVPAAVVGEIRPPANPADEARIRLFARAGSKMRIEGTSNIHDWQVESPLIGGSIEVGSNFPLNPDSTAVPGEVGISGEVFVTARSLKSVKADGQPYSDMMDNIMHDKLLAQNHARLTLQVANLVLNAVPTDERAWFGGTVTGTLNLAGQAKQVKIPVQVRPIGEGRVKISGSMDLKMSDFKIEPPAPAGMLIKTGDGVKVRFEWNVAARTTPGKS